MSRAKFSFFNHTYNLVGEILKLLLTFYLYLILSEFIIFAHLWIWFRWSLWIVHAQKLTHIILDHFLGRHRDGNAVSMWCSRREWVVCAYTGAYRTLNRWSLVIVGVTPQPGGYPSVKGFVCPCAHHHRWSWRPSSSGKAAFFLSSHSHGLKRSFPVCHARKPRSILVARSPATFRDWNNALVN